MEQFPGDTLKQHAAPAVELQSYVRLPVLVKGRTGVDHVLACHQGLGVKRHAASGLERIPGRSGGRHAPGGHVGPHPMEGQFGRLPQELNGPFRVGQARKLYLDTIPALFADVGFGHAELGNAVAQSAHGWAQNLGRQSGLLFRSPGEGIAQAAGGQGRRSFGSELAEAFAQQGIEGGGLFFFR